MEEKIIDPASIPDDDMIPVTNSDSIQKASRENTKLRPFEEMIFEGTRKERRWKEREYKRVLKRQDRKNSMEAK